jgi:hypothetical protein
MLSIPIRRLELLSQSRNRWSLRAAPGKGLGVPESAFNEFWAQLELMKDDANSLCPPSLLLSDQNISPEDMFIKSVAALTRGPDWNTELLATLFRFWNRCFPTRNRAIYHQLSVSATVIL